MTLSGTEAFFTAVSVVVGQAFNIYMSWRNRRIIVKKLDKSIEQTDGMKNELVDVVRKSSFAEGVKSEVDRNGKP